MHRSTFKNIWRTHQVGVTNPYSYLAVVLNAAMWVEFGIPAMVKLVHGHHHTLTDWLGVPLMAANGFGIIVELCYVAIFIRFAPGNRGLPLICLFAISVVSGVVLALLLSTGWSRTFVGWFAMLSGVAMYVMPLHATV
jgi:solute carrier family 50 protein (sugar transporter)